MEGPDGHRERAGRGRQHRHRSRCQGRDGRHANLHRSAGIATNQFLYTHLAFNPETDIVPLGLVATVPNLLCVRKDLPVNSVAELIAYAKANPGKLNYASSGVGTTMHLSAELFKRMAGVEMVGVPIAAARRRSTIWSARTSI